MVNDDAQRWEVLRQFDAPCPRPLAVKIKFQIEIVKQLYSAFEFWGVHVVEIIDHQTDAAINRIGREAFELRGKFRLPRFQISHETNDALFICGEIKNPLV